ncbi:RecQ family ATP-dependent DNA helicase [Lutibacter sp.]
MMSPLEILKKYWNYSHFKQLQEEIITAVLNGNDTVALLPTGGGKSLCYQIPTLLSDGVCIVVSPLIALIHDQVNALTKKNIKAIALTSQLHQEEVIIAFDNLQFGNYKFLYLSPEKLQSDFIQNKIKQLKVSIIAIDEAHCISEWGHDFRPSYLTLRVLKELQPKATTIALTATATKRVIKDIIQQLELKTPSLFKQSFKRENLIYQVIHTEAVNTKLLQILNKLPSSAIVYTNSRKQTKEVSSFLNKNGFKSSFYHGGLSATEKEISFNNWMANYTPIMVATNAFGMGIDKPDVRVVVHLNIPNSIENYIQEAGRAGRDGKISDAIIITNKPTIYETIHKFKNSTATVQYIKTVYQYLNQFYKISIGEMPAESFNFSLQEFCTTYKLDLLKTYNAIKSLERENIILIDDNYTKKSTLKFITNSNLVFSYLEKNPSKNGLVKLLLRSYGGIFDHYTIINEFALSKKLNTSKSEIKKQLKQLHQNNIVNYNYQNTNSKLTFLVARDDQYTINSIAKNITQQNTVKHEKLQAAIAYVKNNTTCRNVQLLSYFGETSQQPCEKCDVCIANNKVTHTSKNISEQIVQLLKEGTLSSQEITDKLTFTDQEILNTLKLLLEKNKITLTSQNTFKLN